MEILASFNNELSEKKKETITQSAHVYVSEIFLKKNSM